MHDLECGPSAGHYHLYTTATFNDKRHSSAPLPQQVFHLEMVHLMGLLSISYVHVAKSRCLLAGFKLAESSRLYLLAHANGTLILISIMNGKPLGTSKRISSSKFS